MSSKANADYEKVVNSLKSRCRGGFKNLKGATAADICAVTALPLSTVREFLPKAADEYSGHLRVTESGEILYHFPNGFKSVYRGLGASLKKAAEKFAYYFKKTLAFLFKVWIMVMLIGYFLLFIAIAIAAVVISIASRSEGKDRRGGFGGFYLFDLLIRLWLYSDLTRRDYNYNYGRAKKENKRPMHKAIFSFVFGEDDPNRNWDEQLNKSLISFLLANKGVISLPEYMVFSGEDSLEAEKSILALCSKYSGSPEATEDGTIVYRFDEIFLRSDSVNNNEQLVGLQQLKKFSSNSKTMNVAFILINAVNMIFGSYFLYQAFAAGQLITQLDYASASKMYAYTHLFLDYVMPIPQDFIGIVLGFIPLVFSIFFWVIPLIRFNLEKKDNEKIKLKNFKRFSFNNIWVTLKKIRLENLRPPSRECCPKDLYAAADRVIKDIGAISTPQVEIDENGKTIYSFNELEREKIALNKYRSSVDLSKLQIGNTVFDSNN